jgi:hypothetical protein
MSAAWMLTVVSKAANIVIIIFLIVVSISFYYSLYLFTIPLYFTTTVLPLRIYTPGNVGRAERRIP